MSKEELIQAIEATENIDELNELAYFLFDLGHACKVKGWPVPWLCLTAEDEKVVTREQR